jgi:hypothetical protein
MAKQKRKLIGPWSQIHAAIWLIGLAILAWRGWWWPGILVLVAISGIAEALIQLAVPGAVAPEPEVGGEAEPAGPDPVVDAQGHRVDLLPAECPKCGAPARGAEVHWTGPQSADCAYCGANLPLREG